MGGGLLGGLTWEALRFRGNWYDPHSPSAGMLSCFSHVWLFVTPWTVVRQAPLSMGFSRAKILKWVAISFSRGSSQPRDQTCVSYISYTAGRIFTAEPPGKPIIPLLLIPKSLKFQSILLKRKRKIIIYIYTHTHTHTNILVYLGYTGTMGLWYERVLAAVLTSHLHLPWRFPVDPVDLVVPLPLGFRSSSRIQNHKHEARHHQTLSNSFPREVSGQPQPLSLLLTFNITAKSFSTKPLVADWSWRAKWSLFAITGWCKKRLWRNRLMQESTTVFGADPAMFCPCVLDLTISVDTCWTPSFRHFDFLA